MQQPVQEAWMEEDILDVVGRARDRACMDIVKATFAISNDRPSRLNEKSGAFRSFCLRSPS